MTPRDRADWERVLERRWQHLDELEMERATVLESIDDISDLLHEDGPTYQLAAIFRGSDEVRGPAESRSNHHAD
jgi:hypothetical protein